MGNNRKSLGIDHSEFGVMYDEEEKFGFRTGSDYTFQDFEKVASNFKESYFGIRDATVEEVDGQTQSANEQKKKSEPSIEDIEGEYWRIIEQPTDEVKVCVSHILVGFLLFF